MASSIADSEKDGSTAHSDTVDGLVLAPALSAPQLAFVDANAPRTRAPTGGRLSVVRESTVRSARDLELRRELTIEERKELAEAGDDALERPSTKKRLANSTIAGFFHKKAPAKANVADAQVDINEHTISLEALRIELDTAFDVAAPAKSRGLTTAEANARLARDGKNVLNPPKGRTPFQQYMHSLLQLFNMLLIICAILEYVLLGVDINANLPNAWLASILLAVAFLNAFIEWRQVQSAVNTLASFMAMTPPECKVIRDGTISTVPASDIVRGDVVVLSSGDRIPADLVMLGGVDAKVDNSALTGEGEPQTRRAAPNGVTGRAVEATNLLFSSSSLVNGEAVGVVIKVGQQSFIGAIASLVAGAKEIKEIEEFVRLISIVAITTAIVFLIVAVTYSYKGQASSAVTFAVSVLVAWVPQGLPATVTLLLSIAARRMAQRNVLVKDLQGVETLGGLTALLSDKTGTLTRNEMTVVNIWTCQRRLNALDKVAGEGEEIFTPELPGAREMIETAVLNSKIKFDDSTLPFAQRKIIGDATEIGLTKLAAKFGDYDAIKSGTPVVYTVPFNSTNKYAIAITHKPHETGVLRLLLKGAPERVLGRCSHILGPSGERLPLDETMRAAYNVQYEHMAGQGHRVIAVGQSLLDGQTYPLDFAFSTEGDGNVPATELTFVGLYSLADPPKHGVREAVGQLRRAGIQIVMVTGDHPLTATAIARRVNIIVGETKHDVAKRTGRPIEDIHDDEYDAEVVHGDQIDSLTPMDWDRLLSRSELVFARTSPAHKLGCVQRFQARGHIVGVTGDGVNDAPALKAADLGISMHLTGSDVSKQAAKLILLDDNFASIVPGVREGRLIFINIQYTLTHIMPEVIPSLLYVLVPIPLPLPAILVIDLGFELFLALSFAFDTPEDEAMMMRQQPRRPVNERSVLALRSKALRRIRTRRTNDVEGKSKPPPGRIGRALETTKLMFTRGYWSDRFAKTDEVKLVDFNVLLYAYGLAGMIETVFLLLSYFVIFNYRGFSPADLVRAQKDGSFFSKDSPDFVTSSGLTINGRDQFDIWCQAQGLSYLAVFFQQAFNVFAVKAKTRPPFGRHIVSNKWNFLGVFAGAALAIFIVYVPPFQIVFYGSYHILPDFWLISWAGGVCLLIMASIRAIILRIRLKRSAVDTSRLALQMAPTSRTMSIRPTEIEDKEKFSA